MSIHPRRLDLTLSHFLTNLFAHMLSLSHTLSHYVPTACHTSPTTPSPSLPSHQQVYSGTYHHGQPLFHTSLFTLPPLSHPLPLSHSFRFTLAPTTTASPCLTQSLSITNHQSRFSPTHLHPSPHPPTGLLWHLPPRPTSRSGGTHTGRRPGIRWGMGGRQETGTRSVQMGGWKVVPIFNDSPPPLHPHSHPHPWSYFYVLITNRLIYTHIITT